MEYVHAVILCTLALLHIQVLAAVDGLNHPQKCGSIRQPLDLETPLFMSPLSSPTPGYRRTTDYNHQTVVNCVLDGMQKNWMLALLEQDGMDVWGTKPDGSIDIRMNKYLFQEIQHLFPGCVTMIEDVEAYVKEAERQIFQVKAQTSDWFESYHTYPEIDNWYCELANSYPHIVKYVPSIGKTVEGRDMPAVHITANTNKKRLYFQCQIHAREWIAGATCMYIANYLAQNYGKNQQVTDLLNSVEFILVPIVNPDGYVYTWTTDRLWRKNRRKGKECDGVDLNRNYNFHWGENGSSSNECSQTYQGRSVESEPETQNVVNYFRQHSPILGAIDWHSYSQKILRPWGNTNLSSPHEQALQALSEGMAQAAYDVHQVRYSTSKGINLYPTSGTASDWFYSRDAAGDYRSAGLTVELRDKGEYGFLLPANQIISTGEEMVPAVLYFAKYLLNNPLYYATE